MTRTRISLLTVATALGAALPAFAQAPAPAPAPMYAPAQAPMMAPAPAPETAVMPAAPMMAPKASDDMTGSVGLGVGVVGGSTGVTTSNGTTTTTGNILVAPDTGNLMLKYWMSDAMAIVPRLTFGYAKTRVAGATEAGPASWALAPEVIASFTLLKGASTRLAAGAGIGFMVGKTGGASDTSFGINIPIELSVEHFFTRWFSMGIAVHEPLLAYTKTGDVWSFGLQLDSTQYMGSLFFYTD